MIYLWYPINCIKYNELDSIIDMKYKSVMYNLSNILSNSILSDKIGISSSILQQLNLITIIDNDKCVSNDIKSNIFTTTCKISWLLNNKDIYNYDEFYKNWISDNYKKINVKKSDIVVKEEFINDYFDMINNI
jgi:hypothetical protein